MRRTKHDPDFLRSLLELRDQRRLTFEELSRHSGVPIGTLSYWSSKFTRERQASRTTLEHVTVVDDFTSPPITIEVGEHLRVQVSESFHDDTLARVIKALVRAAC